MAFRFTSRITQWADSTEKKLDLAVLEMATDIHRISGTLAPKQTRALVNSGQIVRKGKANYSVKYGGGAVPYAKRRHYENKKTPSSLHYLERAGDLVSRNVVRYVKENLK
jgi:hypothetical protein